MGRYEQRTENYDFNQVSSAMQKCIRRGLEDEALFWAVELFNSNFGEYAFKRLRIISSEDVGLADPNISAQIWSLYCMFKEQAKKKDEGNAPERLFLIHAVMLLCRAKKSRLVDWALIHHFNTHKLKLRPIPDFALDKHNEAGRKLKRGWDHFFREGSHLENHEPQEMEEEYRQKAMDSISNPTGNMTLFGD